MTGPPLSTLESVRAELKRLGYLESGLDRFVLGGAGGRSPARASLRAALRVGLLGGPLFGLAGAVAAVGFDRRLIAEPRDLVFLTVVLAVIAGVATAVVAAIGGLAAAWVSRITDRRPGPGLPQNVGTAIALLGLVYVAFWWRAHLVSASFGARSAALVLGLGLSLAFGRFATLAAVAVLVAGGIGDRLSPAGMGRRHVIGLVAAGALVYAGGMATAAYLGQAEAAPDFAVVPTGLRVRVLGVDGLERRMCEQMVARGEMPRLSALLAKGAQGRLEAEPERVPAITWTTIATGRGPEAHGIKGTSTRRITGLRTPLALGAGRVAPALERAADLLGLTRREPPSSVLRGAKAFWNVASEKGLEIGVVNWWATWPADPVNGYVVSDRAFFRLERGGASDREVYPREASARLASPAAGGDRARAIDLFVAASASTLRAARPPDVEAVYLPGLDIFTMQQLGEAAAADVASLEGRLEGVRDYYRFVDGLIGQMSDGLGAGDVLALVGDPGRLVRTGPRETAGVVILCGGPVRSVDLGAVSERDIAPTVLHLVGLPVSAELGGHVLAGGFEPAFMAAHPIRTVPAYGRPAVHPAGSAFDQEMLDELKSLGYVR